MCFRGKETAEIETSVTHGPCLDPRMEENRKEGREKEQTQRVDKQNIRT